MTRRMKLILTIPADDTLEAFENFRKITTIRSTKRKTVLLKEDIAAEWEKFWEKIYSRPQGILTNTNSITYLN